jgi:GNAT superfamily N-acetyltransferase
VNGELEAATEFDRRMNRRAASDAQPIPMGWVLRHPALPDVHHLNLVALVDPLPAAMTGGELAALVDAHQAGLGHRRVMLDDADAGERMSAELEARGWERDRIVWMALRSEPSAALADPRARLLTGDEGPDAQRATMAEEDFGPYSAPGLVDRLLEAQALVRAGTTALMFGAGQGECVASHCTLFCDENLAGRRVAIIDNVATLRLHRRQGLSRAAVSAAIRAAGEWGADLIALPADADDWPQVFYAGLGFVPIGRQVGFTGTRASR